MSDPASMLYDPDEVLPQNSPLLKPHRPQLRLTPSPPPAIPFQKVRPSQGDAVLVGFLGGGRNPEIALLAGEQPLPSDSENEDDNLAETESDCSTDGGGSLRSPRAGGAKFGDRRDRARLGFSMDRRMRSDSPGQDDMGAFDLKSLAAGALASLVPDAPPRPLEAGPTPPVTEPGIIKERTPTGPVPQSIATRRRDPSTDERPIQHMAPTPYSPPPMYSPRESRTMSIASPMDMKSPTNHGEGLPPIQLNTPKSETNGQTPLPSIRSQLGDFHQLANNPDRLRTHSAFPRSPPGDLSRLSSMHTQHTSPPSLSEPFARGPISPAQSHASSYYQPSNSGMSYRSPREHYASNTDSPGTDHGSVGGTPSIESRISIEALSQVPGNYICKVPGCNAPPFQTQYLLNSHANVHSSARPHYCPVAGCPRSEGGKGFKRKNEMIRHGLVHDSPGYVCPFCPDREHKYPRPDNLQRHVRVHHVDKDKDDPLLRDVLAQRPDGPNRGRRRRGGPN